MPRLRATVAAKIAAQSCLVLVLATTSVGTALVISGCSTDMDCYLNGVCSSLPLKLPLNLTPGAGGTTVGRPGPRPSPPSPPASRVCTCYPGWTGPHCGQFDFLPTPPGPLGGKAFPPTADSSCWGSSVINGADGKYHMYSSGILGKCGLAVWAPNAALTHAVSDTLDGVYLPQQDIMRGSNPQITQFGGELRLWHTLAGGPGGPDTKDYCSTCTNGTTPASCRNESIKQAPTAVLPRQHGGIDHRHHGVRGAVDPNAPTSTKLIVATDTAGPWKDLPITCEGFGPNGECPTTSNPTAYYFPNGTTLLAYDWQSKGSDAKGFFLARAPDVSGPYRPVSGHWNVTTITWEGSTACTDPFLWRDKQGAFHAVFHCRNWFQKQSPADGVSDAGGHAFSADGVTWHLAPEPVWTTTVEHTDGTNTTFFHRERPQVFIDPETSTPAALFNAVSLANLNQPFPWQAHCPPHPSHVQVGCDQSMAFVQRIRGAADRETRQ